MPELAVPTSATDRLWSPPHRPASALGQFGERLSRPTPGRDRCPPQQQAEVRVPSGGHQRPISSAPITMRVAQQ